MKINVGVKLPYPLKIFCLTMDRPGQKYLPLLRDELILLDRNVLSNVSSSRRHASAAVNYWVNEFNRVSRNINPIMTAYEGCFARQPSRLEFQMELADTHRKLSLAYPHKNVIMHTPDTSGGLFDALEPKRRKQREEAEFLLETAGIAVNRPNDRDLMPKIRAVLAAASSHGLLRHSLSHIALISCLAESRHGDSRSAGRRVIKPKVGFNDRDAYNAISDLHLLEFLIASSAYSFGSIVLCTMDQGLAQFWHGLQVSRSVRTQADDIDFRFRVDKSLFPRLSNDQLEELRSAVQ